MHTCQQIHVQLADPHPLAVLSPWTFVMTADPPLAVPSPLLSCQLIHLSQSCLHFCHVSRITSQSSTFVSTFVMSAYSPLAVLSPLLSCQQIYLSQSCLHFCHVSLFTSRNPVPTLVVPIEQQINLSQSCLHFCHVSRSTVM